MSLFDALEDLDRQSSTKRSKDKILRAPFGYPGGKSRSVDKIITHLPDRNTYVEAFGGSAAILLARDASPLEVYNDRHGGVVAFYRCIRDEKKCSELSRRLQLCLHSREEFVWCRDTWENVVDDVERAARWYYACVYSFGSLGRNFGRSTSGRAAMAGKHLNQIAKFHAMHRRFTKVQIENQDWRNCLQDYDSGNTVFYLDPPYIDANPGTYRHEMSLFDHEELIKRIFELRGFVALSAYDNPFYHGRGWDDIIKWEVRTTAESIAYSEGSTKKSLEGKKTRGIIEECLYIKEAK
jgi:DNA adenine methylase